MPFGRCHVERCPFVLASAISERQYETAFKEDPMSQDYQYQVGFGNHFATEALPNALPQGRNSPQMPPYGLIAEQISGTAFTAKRHENRRTWYYRIRPSVMTEGTFKPFAKG